MAQKDPWREEPDPDPNEGDKRDTAAERLEALLERLAVGIEALVGQNKETQAPEPPPQEVEQTTVAEASPEAAFVEPALPSGEELGFAMGDSPDAPASEDQGGSEAIEKLSGQLGEVVASMGDMGVKAEEISALLTDIRGLLSADQIESFVNEGGSRTA